MPLLNRWILIPLLLSVSVWSDSLRNGFVWDDHILIEKNEVSLKTSSVSSLFSSDFWSTETEAGHSNYYRPLIALSYMVDYARSGLTAKGYHLTNIIVHTANVALVWCILVELAVPSLIAALAACLFAVHPALAESVAWISGRTDLIATTFMLLSVLLCITARRKARINILLSTLSATAFACALFSKESAIITPLLALLLASTTGAPRKVSPRDLIPYAVAALVWFIARLLALDNPIGVSSTEGVSLKIGILALLHLWGTIVWPPVFRIEYGSSLTGESLAIGAVCGVLLLGWVVYSIRSLHSSPLVRALYIAGIIAFIPSALAIMLKSMIGVRLVYTAAAFILPACVLLLRERLSLRPFFTVTVALCAILSYCSVERSSLWRSDRVLFSKALEASAASTRNHLNLGIALYNDGELRAALEQLDREIEAAAVDQQRYMLALIYTGAQCEILAEREYRAAIQAKPSNYAALHNLAGLLTSQGRLADARTALLDGSQRAPELRARALRQIEYLDKAPPFAARPALVRQWCTDRKSLEMFFTEAIAVNRQASELLKGRQLDMAEVYIKAALLANPKLVAARLNLAQLEILQQRYDSARGTLTEILRENPEETRAEKLLSHLNTLEGAL